MNANHIGAVVKSILLSNPIVVSMTEKRIYPLVALTAKTPCVIYSNIGIVPVGTKDASPSYHTVGVEILVVAETYDKMITLTDEIYDTLQGYRGEAEGIDVKDARLTTWKEVFEDERCIKAINYEFKINNY